MSGHKGLWYKTLGLAGALLVLFGVAGAAYAQGPQPPAGDRPFYGSGYCYHTGRMGGGWGWGARGLSLVDATAEATGLTEEKVIAALQDGQTFAQIAEAQGVDPQAIVDAFLAGREAVLEQAVADGRLTQEQMDWMMSNMAEHVFERLTQPWMPYSFGTGRMGRRGPGFGYHSWGRPGYPSPR